MRRGARRGLAARTAWQLGLLAPYVPWRGPVYWPYAYNDMFYYTFWPDAYDPGYWAYAYDDMFDGVFFPDGAPYAEYAAEGPYAGPDGRVTTGSAPSRPAAPGRITQATRDFCADQAKGVTAWPLEQIADAVQPNEDQKGLLENLRKASEQARGRFKDACPDAVPMTPPGRLQVMRPRLQATDEAVQTVKPALAAFYNSLNDEQKARFNEIGAQLGQPRQPRAAKQPQAEANCSSEKAGISNLAINRIEETVRPTETQGAAWTSSTRRCRRRSRRLRAGLPEHHPADAGRPARRDAEAARGDDRRRQHRPPGARGVLRLAERRAEGQVQPARPRNRAIRRLIRPIRAALDALLTARDDADGLCAPAMLRFAR